MLYVTTWDGMLTLKQQSSYCLPGGGASSVLTALGDKILSPEDTGQQGLTSCEDHEERG
jgi:hypothetical protein